MPTRKATPDEPERAPDAPSALDVIAAKEWLKITDGRKAWAWLIGQRIKHLRETKVVESRDVNFGPRRGAESQWRGHGGNFSQEAFAHRLGFRQGWLSKIETGARSAAVFDVYHIAEALGADPWEILKPPSAEEKEGMEEVKAGIARRRKREQITVDHVAAHRKTSGTGRLRDTLRSARERERERLEVVRRELPQSTRKAGRPPRKR